jgi:hypothetical protein
LRIKNVREDLKAYIKSLLVTWENYKISESMHKEFKKDLEDQIREIVDFYTASAKDLDNDLVDELRKTCSKFLTLVEITADMSDKNWFEKVRKEGDKLCEEFDKALWRKL